MSNNSYEDTVARGRLLDINLSKRSHEVIDIPPTMMRKWLGGTSLGLKILYDRVPAGTDPLGPDNLFIVMTGPLTGTMCPGTRQVLIHKSPHTGLENNSYIGGGVGSALKRAGYDGIIVNGKDTTS